MEVCCEMLFSVFAGLLAYTEKSGYIPVKCLLGLAVQPAAVGKSFLAKLCYAAALAVDVKGGEYVALFHRQHGKGVVDVADIQFCVAQLLFHILQLGQMAYHKAVAFCRMVHLVRQGDAGVKVVFSQKIYALAEGFDVGF